MTILILGASGVIGKAIYKHLSTKYKTLGTYFKNKPDDIEEKYLYKLDISDYNAINSILDDVRPEIIISSLCGNFENQLYIHRRIAEYLKEISGRCIFLSTANVFDGSPDSTHTEDDVPYPASRYGKYKYSCEQMLQSSLGDKCLIARLPSTLSSKSALSMIKQAENEGNIYTNLYIGCNTADNVAQSIQFCIETERSGIIHLASIDYIPVNKYIKLLLSHFNKSAEFTTALLTKEDYCKNLGCDTVEAIHCNSDGNFYLSLASKNDFLPEVYSLSCEKLIMNL